MASGGVDIKSINCESNDLMSQSQMLEHNLAPSIANWRQDHKLKAKQLEDHLPIMREKQAQEIADLKRKFLETEQKKNEQQSKNKQHNLTNALIRPAVANFDETSANINRNKSPSYAVQTQSMGNKRKHPTTQPCIANAGSNGNLWLDGGPSAKSPCSTPFGYPPFHPGATMMAQKFDGTQYLFDPSNRANDQSFISQLFQGLDGEFPNSSVNDVETILAAAEAAETLPIGASAQSPMGTNGQTINQDSQSSKQPLLASQALKNMADRQQPQIQSSVPNVPVRVPSNQSVNPHQTPTPPITTEVMSTAFPSVSGAQTVVRPPPSYPQVPNNLRTVPNNQQPPRFVSNSNVRSPPIAQQRQPSLTHYQQQAAQMQIMNGHQYRMTNNNGLMHQSANNMIDQRMYNMGYSNGFIDPQQHQSQLYAQRLAMGQERQFYGYAPTQMPGVVQNSFNGSYMQTQGHAPQMVPSQMPSNQQMPSLNRFPPQTNGLFG